MMKPLSIIAAIAAVVVFGACSGVKVGASAPAYTAVDAGGATMVSTQYDNRVVLYYFWATWCPPCVVPSPEIDEIAARYRNDDRVEVLAVHYNNKGNPVEYAAQRGYGFRIVPDGAAVAKAFGVKKIPSAIVVGRDGTVIHRQTGYGEGDGAALAALIEAELR